MNSWQKKLRSVNEEGLTAKSCDSADAKLVGSFERRATAAADDCRAISTGKRIGNFDGTLWTVQNVLAVRRRWRCSGHVQQRITRRNERGGADGYSSPVGMIPAFSTIRITVRCGARVRCSTPLGTTKPCPGESSTSRASRSISNLPSTT